MTISPQQRSTVDRGPRSGTLYDVLELILDRGLVIDIYIRVSLVGIELLTIDARIVIASVDTYLRFAEAVNRLDLTQAKDSQTLPEMVGSLAEKGAGSKTKGAISGAADAVSDVVSKGRDRIRERVSGRSEGSDEDSDSTGGRDKARIPRQTRHRRISEETD